VYSYKGNKAAFDAKLEVMCHMTLW
jgi:hypothetical protein